MEKQTMKDNTKTSINLVFINQGLIEYNLISKRHLTSKEKFI